MEIFECANCKEAHDNWCVDVARGDYVCNFCGMVSEERIQDTSLEKRNFSDSGVNHSRTEVVDFYLTGKTIGATILQTKRARGGEKGIEGVMLGQAHKKLSGGTASSNEAHLDTYFKHIKNMCHLLEFEKRVLDTAKDLTYRYKLAAADEKRMSVHPQAFAVAVIHLSCTKLRIGKTVGDLISDLKLTDEGSVTEKDVWEAHKRVTKTLPGVETALDADSVIHNYCNVLGFGMDVKNEAVRLRHLVQEHVEGRQPGTIAAGSITLACEGLSKTFVKEDVAICANIAVGTVTAFCRLVRKNGWTD